MVNLKSLTSISLEIVLVAVDDSDNGCGSFHKTMECHDEETMTPRQLPMPFSSWRYQLVLRAFSLGASLLLERESEPDHSHELKDDEDKASEWCMIIMTR
jgi:hypothetical protein